MNKAEISFFVDSSKLTGEETMKIYVRDILFDEFNILARIQSMYNECDIYAVVDFCPEWLKDTYTDVAKNVEYDIINSDDSNLVTFSIIFSTTHEPRKLYNRVMTELDIKNYFYVKDNDFDVYKKSCQEYAQLS